MRVPGRGIRALGVVAVVVGVLFSGSYASLTLLAPLEPVKPVVAERPAETINGPVLDFPDYGGSAITAIGFPDAFVTHGEEGPMELASVTKVITALVVLDERPLAAGASGPTLTFGSWDAQRYLHHLHNNGSNKPV